MYRPKNSLPKKAPASSECLTSSSQYVTAETRMKDGFGDDDGERRTETLTRKKRRSSSTPRNAFFYGLSVIPDNRYLTEWILSVKPRLYADKLLILSDLYYTEKG